MWLLVVLSVLTLLTFLNLKKQVVLETKQAVLSAMLDLLG
jgi:hypothetical protein